LPRNCAGTLSSIKREGTKLRRGFFIHEYFSCDRREPNKVGKLFDAITLRVYKKITNRNARKSRQHCAAFKHLLLAFVTGFIPPNDSRPFSFTSFFLLYKGTAKTMNISPNSTGYNFSIDVY